MTPVMSAIRAVEMACIFNYMFLGSPYIQIYIRVLAIAHIWFNMQIRVCKINSTRVQLVLHIIDITGQLLSEIAIKSNLVATDPSRWLMRHNIIPESRVGYPPHQPKKIQRSFDKKL